MLPEGKLLLSVPEAAQMLNVGRDFLYREVRAGKLRPVRVGRRVLLSEAEIMRWVGEQEAQHDA